MSTNALWFHLWSRFDLTLWREIISPFPLTGTAFYLPRPSEAEYEFRYVDGKGEVCARSRSYTFCAPKPLEELETLREEEDEDEEDGEEGLLLVIPRAQLLQVGTSTKAHLSRTAAQF